ncbi:hypothetical protein QVD17_39458 [Tagetes erecta]|uniref:Uncharacterized protein n=1 Tax=Tagetes erecta TaxID=13708 RepID=A0AAD8JSE7_TARER|nr:hypothetical protein QVD17_39458 [Tagetes erecta]
MLFSSTRRAAICLETTTTSDGWKKPAWSADTDTKAEFVKFDCEDELKQDACELHVLNDVLVVSAVGDSGLVIRGV